WPVIASGKSVLIQAPTGSGKTLAAFLSAIDRLTMAGRDGGQATDSRPEDRRKTPEPNALRVLYVSPLKALNYDVERNLRGPLAGLRSELKVAVRTGDTPQKERAAMLRHPPDILITTPESLFLMLTSQARELLRSVDTLILDEVHAVAGTKRGAHLALSVERLEELAAQPIQRIGLSATQRPLEEIGRFVGGGRPIELVDAGVAKELDLEVVVPVEDMTEPGESREEGWETRSIWPSIYPALVDLVRAHRSPIVSRCASTKQQRKRSPAPITARGRASSGRRSRRTSRRGGSRASSRPRRSSSASTWAPSTSSSRSSRRSRSRAGCSGSGAPATRSARSRRAASSRSSAPTSSSPRSSRSGCARARSRRRRSRATRSTSSPSRSSRSAPTRRSRSGSCTNSSAAPIRSRISRGRSSRTSSTCSRAATRRTSSRSCGRASSGTAPRE